ncbi:MAG: Ig-like domain-containing protein [Myxococcaceae bacterium]|nr:Ig-like domain-containing protein [Myxococcaceae bacterium]
MRLSRPTIVAVVTTFGLLGCLRPQKPAELASIVITPENARLSRGSHLDFVATGTFSDGTVRPITDEVEWQVEDGFVGAADATVPGRVHGLNVGGTRVKASKGDLSRRLSFQVVGGTIVRLEVNPPRPVVPVGLTLQLQVGAVRADGSVEDVTTNAIYSVMGQAAGVSMRDEAPGIVTGVSAGQATVQVSFDGVSATVPIEVTDATIRQLTLSPRSPTLPLGTGQRLQATASLSDGRSLDVTEQVQWTSSAPSVVFVSMLAGERGTLTARAVGATEVQARLRGVEAATPVTVTGATLERIEASPGQLTLAKGTQATVTATAIYSDGTRTDATARATWTSSAASVATVSAQGVVRGLELGTSIVRAELDGKSVAVPLTVTAAELTALDVAPSPLTLAAGTLSAFTAVGRFSDGTMQDLTEQVLWTAQDAAVVQVSNTLGQRGEVQALSAGQTEVVAALGARTTRVSVTVTPAVLQGLQVSPSVVSLPMGTFVDLAVTGLFSDGSTQAVTAQVTWTSSAPAIASVDPVTNPGRVTGHAVGQAQVRAELGTSSVQLTVLVTPAELTRLEVTPTAPSLARGTTLRLTATGVFSDGSTQDLTTQATWTSSNAPVASVGNASGVEGLVTALAEGSALVSASALGSSGDVTVRVTPATLVSLSASSTQVSVPVGVTTDLTVTGTYSDGSTQDLTAQATWSSTDASTASVSNVAGAHGRVRGLSAGSTSVRATVGAQSVDIAVTVTPATLVSLTISPSVTALPRGASQGFTATGTYSDGSSRDVTTQVAWSTSGPGLSVTSSGGVAAQQLGQTDVIARAGSVEARLSITVTAALLTGLSLTPATASVPLGVAVPFVAIGSYSDGTTQVLTTQATWSSSDVAVVTVSNASGTHGRASTLSVGSAVVTATVSGQSASATVTVQGAALDRIEVSPSLARIAVGTRQRFQATGRYTDGTSADLTTQVTWSVSDAALASASNAAPFVGRVSALAPGVVQVRATRLGVTGEATLTVANLTLASLSITPGAPTVPAGLSQALTATGTFSDASTQDLTDLVAWSSSDVTKVTVSNAALTEGLARALAVGTSTVSATALGQTASITFTVSNALLTGLEVSPATVQVARGLTHDFTATGTFSDGTTADVTSQATWASTSASVASVSNASGSRGRATALGLGSTTLTATLSGQSASATLTVTPAVLQQLQVSPPTASVPRGLTTPFTVTGVFSDGSSADLTEQVTWSTSAGTIASVSNGAGTRGAVQALNVGSATVSASQGAVTGSASVTVTAAQLAAVQLAPANPTVPRGLTRQLSAIGLYTDGTTQDLTASATWTSSDVTLATVSNAQGSEGVAQALDQGAVTITASVGGRTGSTTLTISPAVLQLLQVNPVGPSVPAGLTEQLSATGVYSDSTTQDVTTQVTWASSNGTVAQVSNASGFQGIVTGGAVGSATVTATLAGVSGSVTVTVTPSVLQQLQVTPPNPTRPKGLEVPFQATGVFSDGSTQDLTTQVTWTSTSMGVVAISNASGAEGRATAMNVGTATVTATFGAVSGSAVFTVTPAQLTRVDASPASATMPLGTVRAFQAIGTYTDGSTQTLTAQASWTSSNPAVLDVSNAAGSEGLATTLALGSATVTATFAGFSAAAPVTITQAALASIELNPTGGSTPLGFTRQFIAIGHYTDGTTSVLTSQATWASGDTGKALISNAAASRGLLSTVSTGAVTITATFGGVTGSTAHTVTAATLVSVTVGPTSPTVAQGGTRQLTATGSYSDGSTQDLTETVTWSSSTSGVASVSNASGTRGLVSGLSAGSATITATSGSVSGSTGVTVTP